MTTKAELKREIEELKLDVSIVQGKLYAASRQLQDLEFKEREAKKAKCKHKFERRGERNFEGEGFVDVEYQYCPKCRTIKEVTTTNVVLKSEK